MSGVIKFFKSLVTSEPAVAAAASKTPDITHKAIAVEATLLTPSTSEVKTVKPHVPLIKFRKGGPASGHSVMSGAPSPGVISGHAVMSRGTIEDYQLPARYQRTPLDEKEIDFINRGGPE